MKKRFNTNIDEKKLAQLKEIAWEQGIGVNDLIENWVDEYISGFNVAKDESRWKIMNFDTQLSPYVLEALEENNITLNKHVILHSREWRDSYTDEHIKEFGIEREINADVYVLNLEENEVYMLRYEWIMRDREKFGNDVVNVLYHKLPYSIKDLLDNIDYIWNKKDEYRDFERQIHINGLGVRFMPVQTYDRYTKDTILIYNFIAIQDLKAGIQ